MNHPCLDCHVSSRNQHESIIRQNVNDQAAIFKGVQLQELESPVDLEEDLSNKVLLNRLFQALTA